MMKTFKIHSWLLSNGKGKNYTVHNNIYFFHKNQQAGKQLTGKRNNVQTVHKGKT